MFFKLRVSANLNLAAWNVNRRFLMKMLIFKLKLGLFFRCRIKSPSFTCSNIGQTSEVISDLHRKTKLFRCPSWSRTGTMKWVPFLIHRIRLQWVFKMLHIYVIYVVIFDRFSSILVQKFISMINFSQCILSLSILFLFISLCSLFIRDFPTVLPIRQVCVFCILY